MSGRGVGGFLGCFLGALVGTLLPTYNPATIGPSVTVGSIAVTDGGNVTVGTSTGTQLGTTTDAKLGLYGATPVVRGASVTAPSGGAIQDAEARTALNAVITRLETLGAIAPN